MESQFSRTQDIAAMVEKQGRVAEVVAVVTVEILRVTVGADSGGRFKGRGARTHRR
jgi:hypothetical protein